MASKTFVTAEEYLKMGFDGPAPDYLDGELQERHLGSTPHSEAQERMLEVFRSLKQSNSLFAYPEITLRISPTRYRVADVAVFIGRVRSKYPSEPPEFVIEIVSEDDRHVDIQQKMAEYHGWGVKNIWLVDPWTKKLGVFDRAGFHEVTTFDVAEFGIRLSATEIFVD